MASPLSRPAAPLNDSAPADAHLASLRQALRAADMIAGKTGEQLSQPMEFTPALADLPPAARRCFEARAVRAANAAAGGLAVVASQPVSPAAAEVLSDRLRADLARIERLFADR